MRVVAFADESNEIQAYDFKKGILNEVYRTEASDKEVSRLVWTGKEGKFNVFASSGH